MSQYESYIQWKDWHLDFSFSDGDDLYFRKEFGQIVRAGQRIIEIGFGAGSFLSWAKQRGAEIYGVEIQEALVTAAKAHGAIAVTKIDDLLPFCQQGFDAVVALDVFEHLATDEISSMLASIEKLLKPSGILIVRVPNGGSPFGRWNQHSDATHLTVVTPWKLSQLAIATKLRVVEFRNQARVPYRKSFGHRLHMYVMFAIRECISKAIAEIYDYPSVLDKNIIIVLKKAH
jgi:2-polyprenyl-3-methyl-5-hydroxy-6-metoxy-1,4-benzoquinol methylase